MSGFKPIKDQLVTILQGVSSLSVVYGKEEKVLASYPAACVSAGNFQASSYTLGPVGGGSNKEIYQHIIRLYFRTDEANDPDYEDVLETVADSVLAALRHNVQINGTCDYSLPISGQWKDGVKTSPVRVFEIMEQATVLANR